MTLISPDLATNRKATATQWAAVGFALANVGLLLLTVPLAGVVISLDMLRLVPSVWLLGGVLVSFVGLLLLSAWALWGVLRKFHQSGELVIRVRNQPVSHNPVPTLVPALLGLCVADSADCLATQRLLSHADTVATKRPKPPTGDTLCRLGGYGGGLSACGVAVVLPIWSCQALLVLNKPSTPSVVVAPPSPYKAQLNAVPRETAVD